jgi:protein-disulfide isomerase
MIHLRRHSQQADCFGSLASAGVEAEVRAALHGWRSHMSHGMELADALDPARDHVRGDVSAAVRVVEYGALGSRAQSEEDRAVREKLVGLIDDGRVCLAFRHFPIIDSHPGAWLGALAVEAASLQGRFWELHSELTEAQTLPWATELDTRAILSAARRAGLDVGRLRRALDAPESVAKILQDLYGGIRSGVNGVPTFYVCGIRQDVDEPDELLDRVKHALAGDIAALWPPLHEARYTTRYGLRASVGTRQLC